MLLLVDLDEVFCDFVSGALEVHNWTRSMLEERRKLGQWNMAHIMGLSEDEFWHKIHAQEPNFWLRLRPTPWANELVKLLVPYDWQIVSSPSRNPDCHAAKIRWCRRFFNGRTDPIITHRKYLFAKEGRVLIDDRDKNIEKFREHGGEGIVFPSLGNSLYGEAENPLPYVEEQLRCI